MTEETLRKALLSVVEAEWNPRIEFAMHGEPTMHPDYVGMIKAARESVPRLQIMMTSNGGGILRKPGAVANVRALFDAGLNVLALDDYIGVGVVPKIKEKIKESKQFGDVEIYDYPEQPEGNPHRRHNRSYRMLAFVQDITIAHKGTHAVLTNHAGCGSAPLEQPLKERCAKPFRELGIRWDGSIAMCCNDWRGIYKCGNTNDTPIEEIWNGPGFGAARQVLYAGNRAAIKPCSVCDYHTYRNGLLPDKMGKKSMRRPDAQTYADVAKAEKGSSLAEPRKTDWGF